MIVEQIWTANAYRNFNYLIACGQTGEALAVDPLDHAKCLAAAKAKGWTITHILNTLAEQLAKLPEATLIYPGHDYIARNLAFTLDREPDNAKAKAMLPAMEEQDPARPLVTTLQLEREINTFFRLTSKSVIARLRE